MFDQRHLRAFVAVARTGSITGAALQLGYSQPAVSHQLKEIEKHVGLPLFDHGAVPMRLTPAGLERLAIAEVMLILGQQMRLGAAAATQSTTRPTRRAHSPIRSDA